MFLNLKVDLNGKFEQEGEEKGNENIFAVSIKSWASGFDCPPLPSPFPLSQAEDEKFLFPVIFLVFSPGSGLFMA